jgi:hypothetical protein
MALVRPRLTDHHGILVAQEDVDFAIPFLDEDLPLYVDPFLLWKSPSMQDTSLHTAMIAALNGIGRMGTGRGRVEARKIVVALSECSEAGLGTAKDKKGRRISDGQAEAILSLFQSVPDIKAEGLQHVETMQLLVDGIGRDRVSDFACCLLKSFLIDFTNSRCARYGIPQRPVKLDDLYDPSQQRMTAETVELPFNPETGLPLLLVPRRWLRFVPWINFDSYYDAACVNLPAGVAPERTRRADVLDFNRRNYGMIRQYVEVQERTASDCVNDPLFRQIPVTSAKTKWNAVKKLPTGKADSADKKYEDYMEQLLASLLYPHLDFAEGQSRTDSGVLIRDLIFYNNRSIDFLDEVNQKYESAQIVFELKNVKEIQREHVTQLNRYLSDSLGRFGVLVTRNPLPKAIAKSLIDLWSGQRRCILALTDEDIQTMVTVFESRQRMPIEVLKRAYVSFARSCPG